MRAEFAAVLAPAGLARGPDVAAVAGAALALVTVSFNSEAVLGALLDSAVRHLPGVRVIVVDCGSSDASAGDRPLNTRRRWRFRPAPTSASAGVRTSGWPR